MCMFTTLQPRRINYSNSRLDLDSLIIYDKKKYNYGYLNLSRDTYVKLHNIEKTATNDTLSEIFTKRDEKANIELEGIVSAVATNKTVAYIGLKYHEGMLTS